MTTAVAFFSLHPLLPFLRVNVGGLCFPHVVAMSHQWNRTLEMSWSSSACGAFLQISPQGYKHWVKWVRAVPGWLVNILKWKQTAPFQGTGKRKLGTRSLRPCIGDTQNHRPSLLLRTVPSYDQTRVYLSKLFIYSSNWMHQINPFIS